MFLLYIIVIIAYHLSWFMFRFYHVTEDDEAFPKNYTFDPIFCPFRNANFVAPLLWVYCRSSNNFYLVKTSRYLRCFAGVHISWYSSLFRDTYILVCIVLLDPKMCPFRNAYKRQYHASKNLWIYFLFTLMCSLEDSDVITCISFCIHVLWFCKYVLKVMSLPQHFCPFRNVIFYFCI